MNAFRGVFNGVGAGLICWGLIASFWFTWFYLLIIAGSVLLIVAGLAEWMNRETGAERGLSVMGFRVGDTEWPSFGAWLKDIFLCQLLNRHDWDDYPACRRCGVVSVPRDPFDDADIGGIE